jgi:hypothetical protein
MSQTFTPRVSMALALWEIMVLKNGGLPRPIGATVGVSTPLHCFTTKTIGPF